MRVSMKFEKLINEVMPENAHLIDDMECRVNDILGGVVMQHRFDAMVYLLVRCRADSDLRARYLIQEIRANRLGGPEQDYYNV